MIRRHHLREEILSGTCLTFHQALSLEEQQHELYLWSHIPKTWQEIAGNEGDNWPYTTTKPYLLFFPYKFFKLFSHAEK